MDILSLDLSLTATGVCLPDGETTTIKTANLRGPERLRYIRDQVAIECFAHSVKVCIIEGYSYGSAQGACAQGELGGVIKVLLFEHAIPFALVPPTNRTKYATGSGKNDKDAVLQQAVVRSGRVFGDNNQADAWWLWQMALAHYEPTSPLLVKMPLAHLAALDKVQWPNIGGQ